MRALTIHQPWAGLIAVGDKRIENRSWITKYRGPLAIHASAARKPGLQAMCRGAFAQLGPHEQHNPAVFGQSAIVAIVDLTDVVPVDQLTYEWQDHPYVLGPFCWVLEDVRPVEHVAIRGAQGLWQLPDGLVLEEAKGGGW